MAYATARSVQTPPGNVQGVTRVTKATISTPEYLLDQAKRRFKPSLNNFPGMYAAERKLLCHGIPADGR